MTSTDLSAVPIQLTQRGLRLSCWLTIIVDKCIIAIQWSQALLRYTLVFLTSR